MYDNILLFLTEILLYYIQLFYIHILIKGLFNKISDLNINTKCRISNNMFLYYNKTIFKNLLNCSIVFNKRLKSTAGRCYFIDKKKCKIELSTEICNSKRKIRNILLHEMCHAAVMLIDKDLSHGHGKKFKYWCRIVKEKCQENITTYHNFHVTRNFKYKCNICGNIKKVCNRNHFVYKSKCYKCFKGKYYENT